MKLSSGKRIGQSGGELATASLFSFFLHAILFSAALFYLQGMPKKQIPLFYEVKLVGPQAAQTEVPQAPSVSQPAPPKEKPKAAPPKAKRAVGKTKIAAPKASPAKAKTTAAPALTKSAPPKQVPAESAETPGATPAPPSKTTGNEQAGPVAKGEGIAVSATQQDFKYAYYLNQVRDKISQNWRPPPDAPGAKARVIFSINRSGWVSEVNLDSEHSTGTFGFRQAAIRAIRSSNPFPSLPEDFSKNTLEFSVDLMAEQ